MTEFLIVAPVAFLVGWFARNKYPTFKAMFVAAWEGIKSLKGSPS